MAETYCGKTCTACEYKEKLNCPGCKFGPGRAIGGECDLAKCARSKGHQECRSCVFNGNCGTQRNRFDMPNQIRRKQDAERLRQEEAAKRASFFGKWLMLLFLLLIPSIIGSILTHDTVKDILPVLYVPGQILSVVTMLAHGVILLILGKEEGYYSVAGWLSLICGFGDGVISYFLSWSEPPALALFGSIVLGVLAIVALYNEFQGHASVAGWLSAELEYNWRTLWKWYIWMLLGILVGLVLTLFIPFLGAIAMIGLLIFAFGISIMRLVYLWKTAQLFRNCPVR
jgi:hypothetical protein